MPKVTAHVELIISLKNEGLSVKDISNQLNISDYKIRKVLKPEGLVRSKTSIDKNLISSVEELYLRDTSYKDIANILNIEEKTIHFIVKNYIKTRRNNYLNTKKYSPARKYNLNLEKLNFYSEELAYFLGFIYADGSIYKNTLSIQLKDTDVDVLEKIKTFLEYDGIINFSMKKYQNGYARQCRLIITSIDLITKLKSLGIEERKSYSESFNIDEQFIKSNHFWRGVIDGDGYISNFSTSKKLRLSLCGTKSMLTEFNNYLNFLGFQKYAVCKNHSIFSTNVIGKNAVLLVNHFYSNATIYLDRKYKKAVEMMVK